VVYRGRIRGEERLASIDPAEPLPAHEIRAQPAIERQIVFHREDEVGLRFRGDGQSPLPGGVDARDPIGTAPLVDYHGDVFSPVGRLEVREGLLSDGRPLGAGHHHRRDLHPVPITFAILRGSGRW
jgi:hypothetical protein